MRSPALRGPPRTAGGIIIHCEQLPRGFGGLWARGGGCALPHRQAAAASHLLPFSPFPTSPPSSPLGLAASLAAAANDTFVARPVPVLPPTKLPQSFVPEPNPIVLTDTSAKPEDAKALDYAVQNCDAVVVCFDPKRAQTLDSVRTTWYPRIQKLNPDIPIILACCKADRLSDRDGPSIREVRHVGGLRLSVCGKAGEGDRARPVHRIAFVQHACSHEA